ncbi:MAG: XrtA system polysaccharide chain length determinant [Pseudomonadota bacterium]
MQETIAQVLSYVWGVWRHRWIAISAAWVVALGGWAFVWQLPESYVATARVYVDTTSVLRPLLQGLAIAPEIDQRVRMMSSTLFSRPNLEKLARMTDLDLAVTTPQEKELLIERLREDISLSGQRNNPSLYNISVRDRDRETARRIAQALISVFIDSSLSEKRGDTDDAQSFLDEQIADYERRLVEAESRLARFKQQNVDVLPSKWGADYYTRLEKLREELQSARLELDAASRRRDVIAAQSVSDNASVEQQLAATEEESLVPAPTDASLQELRFRRYALLTRFTEKHPEVQQLNNLIETLEAAQMATKSSRPGQVSEGVRPGSTLYADVQAMLSEAEADVAEQDARVAELQRRERNLAAKVTQIPEVEAKLKALNRDYEVVLAQHEELLERRESARLSQGIEASASDVTFRVVDPPFVPLKPSDPDKLLLNIAVLVVAFGSGIGIALILSMVRPVVVDARSLADVSGMPLLGVATMKRTVAERRQERLSYASFACCVLLLAGAFAGVLVTPRLLPL